QPSLSPSASGMGAGTVIGLQPAHSMSHCQSSATYFFYFTPSPPDSNSSPSSSSSSSSSAPSTSTSGLVINTNKPSDTIMSALYRVLIFLRCFIKEITLQVKVCIVSNMLYALCAYICVCLFMDML